MNNINRYPSTDRKVSALIKIDRRISNIIIDALVNQDISIERFNHINETIRGQVYQEQLAHILSAHKDN